MHKLISLLLISASFLIFSQEGQGLSKEYLESLPVDIRNDVMIRMEQQKKLEENVYRSIDNSSLIDKENQEIDDVFGSNFFNTIQTSFMPINTPNLDDEYILDFGDVLNVQLIGQSDSLDSFQLSRDGSINIPDIGKLYLSGLSLMRASEIITAKVSETYIGTDAFISLKNIRDVNVLVSGDAFNPGIYTLNGNSNLLHALHAAGGINKYGSYRKISLIRDGNTIDKIDIYDVLIKGSVGSKIRLKTGDVVFVHPRENIVTVSGAFMRPSKFELLKGQFLSDAIKYANGISPDADLSNIYLYRILDGEHRDIPISNKSQFDKIEAYNEDRVFIRKHNFRTVNIDGSVLRPGSYKMIEGDNIFDLIERAGGYTLNAFPEGAIYLNNQAKEINSIALQRLYNEFIDSLLLIMQKTNSQQIDIASLTSLAKELKNSEPNGRIVIDLLDDSNPTLVRNGDTLIIPERSDSVFIFGEVANTGSLIFQPGANLDFYISEASGLKDTADKEAIFILYPNGRTKQFLIKKNIFSMSPKNIEITSGSVIYVPRKIEDTFESRLLTTQTYATILGNLGLSLASISAINNK